MGLYEILPHYLQGLRDHMLGVFCDCNNCEFPDFERPHYFIEKISTSFEVEKIPALKQTLVFMSKILKKIFKDGSSQKAFSKMQSILRLFKVALHTRQPLCRLLYVLGVLLIF